MKEFIIKLATTFERGDKYLTFINAMYSIFAFCAGIFVNMLIKYIKTYKIKKVLSFSKKECFISLPYYERILFGRKQTLVIQEEAKLQQKIMDLLNMVKITPVPFSGKGTLNCDEIHIGGPIANIQSSTYINNYFPKLKWNVLPKHREKYNENDIRRCYDSVLAVATDKEGFSFGNGNFFEYEKNNRDCAIIIKLTPKDLNMNKTVHLLFGGGFDGTDQAVNFFVCNYPWIFKKFGSNHYFIVIQVNKKDKTINLAQGFTDLTEKAFPVPQN